jgi:hypothetical protein
MERLVAYLSGHLQEARDTRHDILINSHFTLQDGPHISQRSLTLAPDGSLYEIEWDDEIQAFRSRGEAISDTLELVGVGDHLHARVGLEKNWQKVHVAALNRPLMKWLLDNSPDGDSICDEDHTLAEDEELCPWTEEVAEPPVPKEAVKRSSSSWTNAQIAGIVCSVVAFIIVMAALGYGAWTLVSKPSASAAGSKFVGQMMHTKAATSTPTNEAMDILDAGAAPAPAPAMHRIAPNVSQFDAEPYLRL